MKKPMFVLGGLFAVVVALSLVRIYLVSTISTTGMTLVELQNQAKDIEKQNELLREQYLQAASLTTINAKAKEMGFIPVKSQLNMDAPPLAKR